MGKSERQRTAREKIAEERRRYERRRRRIRAALTGFGALATTAVVVTAVVVARSDDDLPAVFRGDLAPVSRQADHSIAMAKAGVTAPVLEIFEDFQCPTCKIFEETSGATVKKLAASGAAKVIYRPYYLFVEGAEPAKSNSRRALNASLCAPADRWVPYHDVLFKNQPDETDKGFTNDDLIAWAKDVGITGDEFETCVTGQRELTRIEQISRYATETRKVEGTPTLFLNGRELNNGVVFSASALERAVRAAPRPAPVSPPVTAPATSASTSPAVRSKAQPSAGPAGRSARPGKPGPGQAKAGQAKAGQAKAGQAKAGTARPGKPRPGTPRPGSPG